MEEGEVFQRDEILKMKNERKILAFNLYLTISGVSQGRVCPHSLPMEFQKESEVGVFTRYRTDLQVKLCKASQSMETIVVWQTEIYNKEQRCLAHTG